MDGYCCELCLFFRSVLCVTSYHWGRAIPGYGEMERGLPRQDPPRPPKTRMSRGCFLRGFTHRVSLDFGETKLFSPAARDFKEVESIFPPQTKKPQNASRSVLCLSLPCCITSPAPFPLLSGSTVLVPRVSFAATCLSRDPYRIMRRDEENYIRLIPVLIISLTPWMECFPHTFHLFHVSIWERARRKRLERGGPLKKKWY